MLVGLATPGSLGFPVLSPSVVQPALDLSPAAPYWFARMHSQKAVEVSLTKGLAFRFRVSGHDVEYLASSLGRERLAVDGVVVSRARSMKTTSQHDFVIDSVQHAVRLTMDSLTKGPIRCTLSRQGEPVSEYTLHCIKPARSRWERFLPPLLVGGTSGWAYNAGHVSTAGLVISVALVAGFAAWRGRGRWECDEHQVSASNP